jgi:hypothetical protein
VNCPLCSSPLLFGATNCPCGYNLASHSGEVLAIELSYWEALRAFWRLYWPSQLLLGIILLALEAIGLGGGAGSFAALQSLLLQVVLNAVVLFLFVPRICSRPYRGFALTIVDVASGEASRKLRAGQRLHISLFLWWRQILAGLFAGLLAMPLNALLAIMGLEVSQAVASLAGILIIGPILLKMLIGHEFDGFRVEARRQ